MIIARDIRIVMDDDYKVLVHRKGLSYYNDPGDFEYEYNVRLLQVIQPDPVRDPSRLIGIFVSREDAQ